MRRRALLSTIGIATLPGCGWSQYTNSGGGPGRRGDAPETSTAEPSDNDDENEPLPSSEGGDDPITADAEALLLQLEDLDTDEWEEMDRETTETCNTFQREGSDYTFVLESCAAVYDDEATAEEEYESAVDRSRKILAEELDVTPEIGDRAAMFGESVNENRIGEQILRLLFVDSNATGQVEFTKERGISGGEGIPEVEARDVVEWGVRMHDRWRS